MQNLANCGCFAGSIPADRRVRLHSSTLAIAGFITGRETRRCLIARGQSAIRAFKPCCAILLHVATCSKALLPCALQKSTSQDYTSCNWLISCEIPACRAFRRNPLHVGPAIALTKA
jgi:hypothetical protein